MITKLLAIGSLLSVAVVESLWHPRLLIVTSGSMAPALPAGSLVLIARTDQYQIDDIITFSPERSHSLITHRIEWVAQAGDETKYRTKGDANPTADASPVAHEQILGKAVWHWSVYDAFAVLSNSQQVHAFTSRKITNVIRAADSFAVSPAVPSTVHLADTFALSATCIDGEPRAVGQTFRVPQNFSTETGLISFLYTSVEQALPGIWEPVLEISVDQKPVLALLASDLRQNAAEVHVATPLRPGAAITFTAHAPVCLQNTALQFQNVEIAKNRNASTDWAIDNLVVWDEGGGEVSATFVSKDNDTSGTVLEYRALLTNLQTQSTLMLPVRDHATNFRPLAGTAIHHDLLITQVLAGEYSLVLQATDPSGVIHRSQATRLVVRVH